MRDYHPARLPFFARRNSHFDQFEFFAGPVTLARPHLRLATFCATILISSSLLFLSFLVLCDVFSYSLSQTLVSSLWYLLYAPNQAPFLSLDRNDSFHLAMTISRDVRGAAQHRSDRVEVTDGWPGGGLYVFTLFFFILAILRRLDP